MQDLIPTLPLTFVLDMGGEQQFKVLYLMKVIRILEGLKYYNIEFVMTFLKEKNSD